MNLFRLTLSRIALLVAGLLATPQLARADLRIYLQQDGVNGGAITLVGSGASFTSASFTGTYGSFAVTIFGGASTNTSTLSSLLSSAVSIHNNTGVAATLRLYVSQDGFNLPIGSPLNVESGLSGTVNVGTVGLTNIFRAWADRNNNLLGMSDFTNGPQTATQTGSTFDTGSAFGLFNRTGDYSVTSLAEFLMSGGGTVNYSDHVNLSGVPAPAAIILALSGAPCLVGAWLRRRKAPVIG
jgi:hypothetical protein